MTALIRPLFATGLVALATGCASLNPPPPVDVLPTAPPPIANVQRPVAPVNGSLFQGHSYRPSLEDQRARLVGDLVTISIVEKIDARQNSASNVSRNSNTGGGITALPFISNKLSDKIAARSKIGAEFENSFAGQGDTLSKNEFTSEITAIVTDVLPNGHLLVAGEKQVGVNRSVDVLRFSGTVDPRRLGPGSVIDSRYVANLRVISRGLGDQAEAQATGWLQRAFNSVIPF